MSLLIGSLLAFLFLEWPWQLVVIVPLALIELGEVWLFLRLRDMRAITGAEAMVGSEGTAVSDCAPDGQVKVKGQLWTARCPQGASRGDRVEVTDVEGLRLVVAPRS